MIVSEEELSLILNPRIRQRTVRLPVRYGEFGERKKCPVRRGGVYTLRAAVPYAQLVLEAAQMPSRAMSVLWLFDACSVPVFTATVEVTVNSVSLEEDGWWLVRFSKGDRSDVLDRPRWLAARPGSLGGDYTEAPSLALRGTAEEIPENAQKRYADSAWERRANGLDELRARLLEGVAIARLEAARQNVGSAGARKRLKSIEHHLRAWEQEARRSA